MFLNDNNIPHNKHFDGTPNICNFCSLRLLHPEKDLSSERKRQRWTILKEARVRYGAISISMRSFSSSVVPNSHDWCYMIGLRQIERNGKKFSFYLSILLDHPVLTI
jgi:hypothetical protein